MISLGERITYWFLFIVWGIPMLLFAWFLEGLIWFFDNIRTIMLYLVVLFTVFMAVWLFVVLLTAPFEI